MGWAGVGHLLYFCPCRFLLPTTTRRCCQPYLQPHVLIANDTAPSLACLLVFSPVGRRHSDLLARASLPANSMGATAALRTDDAHTSEAPGVHRPSLPGGPYQLAPEPRRWDTTAGDLGGKPPQPLASAIPPKFRQQGDFSQHEEKKRKAAAGRQWWPSPARTIGSSGASPLSWHQ